MTDQQYEWPPDILHYETKYVLGLTLVEILVIALPAVAVIMVLKNLFLGALVAIAAFLIVRRWGGLGDMSVPVFLFHYIKASIKKEPVAIPSIHPARHLNLTIHDLSGQVITRISSLGGTSTPLKTTDGNQDEETNGEDDDLYFGDEYDDLSFGENDEFSELDDMDDNLDMATVENNDFDNDLDSLGGFTEHHQQSDTDSRDAGWGEGFIGEIDDSGKDNI